MSKSILDPEVVEDVIARGSRLNVADTANWGKMSATEMLAHCNLAHQSILKAPPAEKSGGWKKWIAKIIFLHVMKEFPKGARGAERFDMKGKVDVALFEEEKSKFVHIIGKYSRLDHKLAGYHPRFGALNHREWGIFVWRHVDHHLRQFGL
ncbi:DUF1569 domain-containing protein [Mongoliibacter ruber]|uniref:Uncharacterized protein DUF1569 n=1 Tax=Mongoliibacter ruber TaxID=1750599 RepID=A0A2T0WGW0_9BACT|nr:DUF1569 domain-containing protein [Mongoliibacter ruber]PRY85939.1 uncharacterized protein DUF1569 [Mongoliibacter ruber]